MGSVKNNESQHYLKQSSCSLSPFDLIKATSSSHLKARRRLRTSTEGTAKSSISLLGPQQTVHISSWELPLLQPMQPPFLEPARRGPAGLQGTSPEGHEENAQREGAESQSAIQHRKCQRDVSDTSLTRVNRREKCDIMGPTCGQVIASGLRSRMNNG